MKKNFGLIGYPLSHSFSPKYFEEKFQTEKITDAEYKLFPIENLQEFPELLKKEPSLCGLNVTIPHKEKIIPFVSKYAKELESNIELVEKFVGMYVNEFTLDYGTIGKIAIKKLYQMAYKEGHITKMPVLDFVE